MIYEFVDVSKFPSGRQTRSISTYVAIDECGIKLSR